MFRAGTVFVWLWLLGVTVFLGYAVWGIVFGRAESTEPPATGDKNRFVLLGAGFGMLVFGLLFLKLLRRVEPRVQRLLEGSTTR